MIKINLGAKRKLKKTSRPSNSNSEAASSSSTSSSSSSSSSTTLDYAVSESPKQPEQPQLQPATVLSQIQPSIEQINSIQATNDLMKIYAQPAASTSAMLLLDQQRLTGGLLPSSFQADLAKFAFIQHQQVVKYNNDLLLAKTSRDLRRSQIHFKPY